MTFTKEKKKTLRRLFFHKTWIDTFEFEFSLCITLTSDGISGLKSREKCNLGEAIINIFLDFFSNRASAAPKEGHAEWIFFFKNIDSTFLAY